MKITLFINFSGNLLRTPIAITLDDSDTLYTFYKTRVNEHDTPYNIFYNSSIIKIKSPHKNQVFDLSDFQKSLHELGLRDNDSIDLSIIHIHCDLIRNALKGDLIATHPDDPLTYSTPLALKLIAQRQLSTSPWLEHELQELKEDIKEFRHTTWLPAVFYNQLIPFYSMLNLLHSPLPSYDQAYIKYYMERFLRNEGDLATLNHAIKEWNNTPEKLSPLIDFTLLELMLVNDFSLSIQATVLIIGYLVSPIQKETLARKSSVSDLMPDLQNAIEEKNDVLLQFDSMIRNVQVLLFGNELRFLFKEKEIKNSEVKLELFRSNKIIITNMNLATLVEIGAIPIIPEVVKHVLLVDLEATRPEEALSNLTPSSLTLIAQREQSKKPWTETEVVALQDNLAQISGGHPADYPQLLPQYAMLNLLRSQAPERRNPCHYPLYQTIKHCKNKFDLDEIKIKISQYPYIHITFDESTKFTEGCLAQLAEALQNNKRILTLILSGYNVCIDNQTAIALAKALQWNTTLEKFSLVSCFIKKDMLGILVAGLKNNKTLLDLVIADSAINELDAIALADLLRTNTTLRCVKLTQIDITLSDSVKKALIAAANYNMTLENFTFNDVQLIKNTSLQNTHRTAYTTHCMQSILNKDFKNLTDVTRRSGYLNFQRVDLDSLGETIMELQLCPKVLVLLIKEYLADDITLVSLPMITEVFAKKPSLAELTKDVVIKIEENKKSVVITFTKDTLVERKLLLRNALMDLFREKEMKAIAEVNSITGALTISNVTVKTLEKLNIIPRSHHNRCIIT